MLIHSESLCKPPCDQEEFQYQMNISPFKSPSNSELILFYNSIQVEFGREVVLYDFNTIVAAVGGSMGLFLGFSFYDSALKLASFILQRKNKI
jgi:hypothetical protein